MVLHLLAPVLLGRDPLEIDRLWADMFGAVSYSGWAGAEIRAISAVDLHVAKETRGQYITPRQMRQSIEPIRQIRQEFGEEMEIAVEFHGYWNLPAAIRIAQELEPHRPMWLEEMLPQDNLYSGLVTATAVPAQDGEFPLPPGPGLGVELNPELLASGAAEVQRIT